MLIFICYCFCLSVLVILSSATKDCGRIKIPREDIFPWVINIYQSKGGGGEPKIICSGTLVSESIILSAASCFYSDTTKEFRKENLYLTIDHKYKQWVSHLNNSIQTRQIFENEILKPKKYIGFSGRYIDNIAITKLSDHKKIKNYEPVCVDWDVEFTDVVLEDTTPILKIQVWQIGIASTSTILEALFVAYDECKYFLRSKNARQFLTYDKLCIKLKDPNVIPSIGSGVYAFSKSRNRWFIIGITSEITSGDSYIYITYTKLHAHINWIANSVFLNL